MRDRDKNYAYDDLIAWAYYYNHIYGINLADTYPHFKSYLMDEIYTSLPNYYESDFLAGANLKNNYKLLSYGLLDSTNRSYLIWHANNQIAATSLPLSEYHSNLFTANAKSQEVYLHYYNYTNESGSAPPSTSENRITALSQDQIFRKDWTTSSDWLRFYTWNKANVAGSRHASDDQLAFEYYSKGELFMPIPGICYIT